MPRAKDTHFILFRNKAKRVATLPKDQAGRPSTYSLSLMAKYQLKSDAAHRALAGWIRASEQPERVSKRRGRHRQSRGLLDKPVLATGFILPAKGYVCRATAPVFRGSVKGPRHQDALCRPNILQPSSFCVSLSCPAEVHVTGAPGGWHLVSGS